MLSVCVHFGFGRHSWDITDWVSLLYVANITGVCSIIAAAWSKTSFAITLLRLSQGWMRWLVWFIIASVNIFLGLSCIFTYVQCTPVRRLWDNSIPGTCWPQNVVVRYNTFSSGKCIHLAFVIQSVRSYRAFVLTECKLAWSGAMDILLATLPWWMIDRGFLNRKERIGVLVAMSMGSL
jgi:hypothetical protein